MKLQIAVALSHRAKILIFDEATSGLDPLVRDDLLDILLEYIQDEAHTVLLSSHIISDLEKVSDYIAFIQNGRLLFGENKDEILTVTVWENVLKRITAHWIKKESCG